MDDDYVEIEKEAPHNEAEASFASNASFFDEVVMPKYPDSRLAPKILRGVVSPPVAVEEVDVPAEQDTSSKQQEDELEDERRESVDSVAPPSFRTVRGMGAKRASRRPGNGWRLF
jgi:hypothetical protein